MALHISEDGYIFDVNNGIVSASFDTKGDVGELLAFLEGKDAETFNIISEADAKRLFIAEATPPSGAGQPNLQIPPSGSSERQFIRITRSNARTYANLYLLKVALISKGNEIDKIDAVSGQASVQRFRTARMSRAGSQEPLPEGYWDLGRVEFASGRRGDYSVNWPHSSNGLGPVWVDMSCTSYTERGAIGFHLDNNRAGSPGTVGCVGIVDRANLEKFVSWFDDPRYSPRTAVVNWGLGTVETYL